jgi:hypothetical protein
MHRAADAEFPSARPRESGDPGWITTGRAKRLPAIPIHEPLCLAPKSHQSFFADERAFLNRICSLNEEETEKLTIEEFQRPNRLQKKERSGLAVCVAMN